MSDTPQPYFDPPPQQPERQSKRAQLESLWHNSFKREKTPEPVEDSMRSLAIEQPPNRAPAPAAQPEEPAQPEKAAKRSTLGSLFSFSSKDKASEPSEEKTRGTPEEPAAVEATLQSTESVTDEAAKSTTGQTAEQLEEEKLGTRAQLGALMQVGWEKGLVLGKEQLAEGTIALKHSLGLGKKPNVIPPGEAAIDGDHRTVEIGWHPVAGMSGKWFAEQSGIGKMITKEVGKYPDPSQHWGVLVGDYVHQLWMDENLDVIYFNEKLVREDWRTFEVGKTRFTDEALRQAGEMTIHNMRSKRAAYNIISNNCQNFATALLDAIQIGAHHEFATSFAVYQRATGSGAIRDLFVDKHPEEQKTDVPIGDHHSDTVTNAQHVMQENTTQLDNPTS